MARGVEQRLIVLRRLFAQPNNINPAFGLGSARAPNESRVQSQPRIHEHSYAIDDHSKWISCQLLTDGAESNTVTVMLHMPESGLGARKSKNPEVRLILDRAKLGTKSHTSADYDKRFALQARLAFAATRRTIDAVSSTPHVSFNRAFSLIEVRVACNGDESRFLPASDCFPTSR